MAWPRALRRARRGHPLALPPGPGGLELPDGNRIETNDWQREVWAHFDDRGLTCGNAVLL